MFCRLFPFLFIVAAHAAEFSVYLTPPELTENGKSLATVGDLHIDVNDKAIPMELVEGRQSIAYPCASGSSVEFFRVADDEKQTRTRVASTAVPADATQGLLVLTPASGGGYKIIPFWLSSSETKKGSAVFVNLSGRPLGLACNDKRIKLLPKSRWIVEGKFTGSQMLVPTRVEIFAQADAVSRKIIRLIDRHVGIPKDDTGIYLILPKQENYVTLIFLEGGGLRDPVSKAALQKQLTSDPRSTSINLAASAGSDG